MTDHHRAELLMDTLDMAHARTALETGCVIHSDHGSEYTSTQSRDRIRELGLRQSCGRTLTAEARVLPDPRNAQIERLKAHDTEREARIPKRDAIIEELTASKKLALSPLAAQHEAIQHLRNARRESPARLATVPP
jgi:hypothetical protein